MSEPKGLLEALVGTHTGGKAQAPSDHVRAVAWARVSTDMQEERGLSIPEELREIRVHAEKQGIERNSAGRRFLGCGEREGQMGFLFGGLEVYQRALELVEEIHSVTGVSSQGYGHVVSQLRRAATSIPLNIAAGFGRYNEGEKRRFYQIARASCHECVAALDRCHRCKVVDEAAFSPMKKRSDEIGRVLTGLIKAVERRAPGADENMPQS